MAAASVGDAQSLEDEPLEASQSVTIVRGDTLYGLAQRFGVTLDDLVAVNRDQVRNVNHIEVGQVLKVPVPSSNEPRSLE